DSNLENSWGIKEISGVRISALFFFSITFLHTAI
ncbi:unnamed protein product, partial [marine sediment metagenome]